MDDLLSDILSTVKFSSAIYFIHGFCGDWGMDILGEDVAQFHLVTKGNCLVYKGEEEKPLKLSRGDIIIFQSGNGHRLKSHPHARCRPGTEVVKLIQQENSPFQGNEVNTELVCGHFEMDNSLSHPILQALPPCILIKQEEYGRFDLIYAIVELIIEELSWKKPGYQLVSLRLAEVLFLSIIRHHYLKQGENGIRLFADELIYIAVNLIHNDLAFQWKIDLLARRVGLSRTAFIDRFKAATGLTPIKYISNWRITKAKYLLKHTNMQMMEIAETTGYLSETSFNRAFKKHCAISPGKFRRSTMSA